MNDLRQHLCPYPQKVIWEGALTAPGEKKIIKIVDSKQSEQSYRLTIDEQSILIEGGSAVGIYYGEQTLLQLIETYGQTLPIVTIEDAPRFPKRGMLIDITRGRVPTMKKLKELIDLLSHFKYNQLQLYMEHTFDFSFMKSVTKDKDPISHEELKEIDDYCFERHMELIPCIATFGHMYEILQNDEFKHLCEYENVEDKTYSWMKRQLHHTIDCQNPESLALIYRMIDEITPLYRSPYLNISGDETYDIGKGRNATKLQELGVERLYVDFLNNILDHVEQVGKKPMYWGDIILQHPNHLKEINDNATPLHWWYEAQVSEADFKIMSECGRPFYACPSVAAWNRFIPDYDKAYQNISRMTELADQYGAVGILNTEWGDFGHVNHLSGSIPYMIYAAQRAWNPHIEIEQMAFQKFVSMKLYGIEEIIPLMNRLNEVQSFTWVELMTWYYENFQEDRAYGSMEDHLSQLDDQSAMADIKVFKASILYGYGRG
jgi:hypothetical protein